MTSQQSFFLSLNVNTHSASLGLVFFFTWNCTSGTLNSRDDYVLNSIRITSDIFCQSSIWLAFSSHCDVSTRYRWMNPSIRSIICNPFVFSSTKQTTGSEFNSDTLFIKWYYSFADVHLTIVWFCHFSSFSFKDQMVIPNLEEISSHFSDIICIEMKACY